MHCVKDSREFGLRVCLFGSQFYSPSRGTVLELIRDVFGSVLSVFGKPVRGHIMECYGINSVKDMAILVVGPCWIHTPYIALNRSVVFTWRMPPGYIHLVMDRLGRFGSQISARFRAQ